MLWWYAKQSLTKPVKAAYFFIYLYTLFYEWNMEKVKQKKDISEENGDGDIADEKQSEYWTLKKW